MQEISDLKNIVIQSLESNGMLSQLRAQIRASVFKIIEEQESKEQRSPAFYWENPLVQKVTEAAEGETALSVMVEFMEFFRMDYTHNLFCQESNFQEGNKSTRQEMARKMGLPENDNKPILFLMLEKLMKDNQGRQEN